MAPEEEELGEYEGYPIIDTGVIVTNTGDGLSDALHVDYVYVEAGKDAHSVMRLRKSKDQHEFIRDKATGKILGVKLIQVFRCTGAAFSEEKLAQAAVAKMMDKVAEAKALAKGQLTMDVATAGESNVSDIKKGRARKAQGS
jgi:hypothetical protein